jgi:iron complex outermembrane receptor protein
MALCVGTWAAQGAEVEPAATSNTNNVKLTDLSLEDLMKMELPQVSGASRHEQKVSDAPASVSIVTSEDIKYYGYRNLADVLSSVRGIFVSNDRNYAYVGMRGFNRPGDFNGRTLFLVDGHRLNENIFDSAVIELIDVDTIDRVEVIRGPSSSLYGSSAFFGVVNIFTKQGRTYNGLEASFEAGSFDAYKGRLSYGQQFSNGVELALSGSYLDKAGQSKLFFPAFDDPANNNGIATDRDYERIGNFITTLSYGDFALQGAYTWREKGIPTGSYGTVFNDPRSRTIDEQAWADLKYEHKFEKDWDVRARASFNHYHFEENYPLAVPPAIVVNKDDVDGQWAGGEVQVTKTLWDRHTIIAGTEYRNNYKQNQLNYDIDPPATYADDRRQSSIVAFYGQAEISFLTNLVLNAGVRYSHYDTFGDTTNPRLGLIYHPWVPTTFKLLYGQAFRAPNAFEAFFESPSFKSNPSLKPETIRTYEVVYEQELPHYLRFSASAYYYKIDDLISQSVAADGRNVFENLDQVDARGLELELEGRHPSGVRARASYALQRAEDSRTNDELSNSPRHLAKLNVLVPIYEDKILAGLELQYSSDVKTLAGKRTDPYWLLNATLFSQKIVKGLEFSASVYNLLDQRYSYPGGAEHCVDPAHCVDVIQQDGISFRLKLTYRF